MAAFWTYAAGRIGSAAITLFAVSIAIFLAIHLIPGSFADILVGPNGTQQGRQVAMARLGLDKPLAVQYGLWLSRAARGDFGLSLTTGQPIANEFVRRAPVTIELTLLSVFLSALVGYPLGIIGGLTASGRLSRGVSRLVGALAMGVPNFVLGSVLVASFLYLVTRLPTFVPWHCRL
jgi:peptide/nickel transport system permease protein